MARFTAALSYYKLNMARTNNSPAPYPFASLIATRAFKKFYLGMAYLN